MTPQGLEGPAAKASHPKGKSSQKPPANHKHTRAQGRVCTHALSFPASHLVVYTATTSDGSPSFLCLYPSEGVVKERGSISGSLQDQDRLELGADPGKATHRGSPQRKGPLTTLQTRQTPPPPHPSPNQLILLRHPAGMHLVSTQPTTFVGRDSESKTPCKPISLLHIDNFPQCTPEYL